MAMWNNQMVILFGGEVVHSASHKRGASDLSIPWSTRFPGQRRTNIFKVKGLKRWGLFRQQETVDVGIMSSPWMSNCEAKPPLQRDGGNKAIKAPRATSKACELRTSQPMQQLWVIFLFLMVPTLIFEVFLKFHDLHDDPTDDQALEWFPTRWWSFHDRNCSPCCWGPLYFWNVGLWTGQEPTEPNLTNNNFGFNVWTYWTRRLQQQKTKCFDKQQGWFDQFLISRPEIQYSPVSSNTTSRQAGKSTN